MAQFKAEAGKTYVNSATGQKVSYTADQLKDVATGFLSDQFKVEATPVAPVATPAPATPAPAKTSPVISTSTLTQAPNPTKTAQAADISESQTKLKTFLDAETQKTPGLLDKQANGAFLDAVSRAKNGQLASAEDKAGTMTVRQALEKYGLTDYIPNYGMDLTPDDKVEPEKPQSYLDQLTEKANSYTSTIANVRANAKEQAGVSVIQKQMSEAQAAADATMAALETKKTELEANDIINEEAKIALKDKIQGQGIPMAIINRQLLAGTEDLDQAQRMKRLYDVYEINAQVNTYNAQLRNVQLIQGNYKTAMENVQQNIEDWKTGEELKMQVLEEQGLLEKEDRARAEAEIALERKMGLDGYVHIESTDTYNKIVKELGVTADTFGQFFYKDPNGKIYLKPGASGVSSTEADIVADLVAKYPDAGIGLKDSLAVAQTKLPNSRIYKQKTRLAGEGGGGSSGGGGGGVKTVSTANLSERTKAVYENPGLLNNYTPTEKGKIIDELAGAGLSLNDFAINDPTGGQREQIAQFDDLTRQGEQAADVLEAYDLNLGLVAGNVSKAKSLVGLAPEGFNELNSLISNMSSALLKLRSGAAVTPQEFERIKGFIPSVTEDEKTVKQKLASFIDELEVSKANYILRVTQTASQIKNSTKETKDADALIDKYSL